MIDLTPDFNTDPLSGLCDKPAHLMTREEMTNHILRVRQMRQSAQVFKQETEIFEEVKERATPKTRTKKVEKVDISDLDNMF